MDNCQTSLLNKTESNYKEKELLVFNFERLNGNRLEFITRPRNNKVNIEISGKEEGFVLLKLSKEELKLLSENFTEIYKHYCPK